MKIIYKDTSDVVVEDKNGDLIVHNKNFEREWKVNGIAIPAIQKDSYGGAAVIKLGEPNFKKALVEVYYKYNMNHGEFTLEE